MTNEALKAEARAIHDRLLTIDTHIDTGTGFMTELLDPGRITHAQVDLPKMRVGGLDAGFFIVYTGQGLCDAEGYASARLAAEAKYSGISRMFRAYPKEIAHARTVKEVQEIHASGRLVGLIGMENAYPLGNSLADIPVWAARGVCYISITHFGHNQFGCSSNPNHGRGDSGDDTGLTAFGEQLVTAMNESGIMVDLSHVGRRTGLEALEASKAPVIASHSSASAVFKNSRNLDDEQLCAIRDKGGVAQMCAFRGYLGAADPAISSALAELRNRLGLTSPSNALNTSPQQLEAFRRERAEIYSKHEDITVKHFVDHIDHAVKTIGIDYVGIASDFDGGGGIGGWDSVDESPNVTFELLQRGYDEADLEKLWGGNIMRVMHEVQARASIQHNPL
ncbi:MAG: dipeptidase [Rhodospirillales bacterium]|jgi:membrane dipeptidase